MANTLKETDDSIMVFDELNTADGHDIYWLHKKDDNRISPEELFYDKYEFMETCKYIVTDGIPYKNYAIDKSDIALWEDEKEQIAKERLLF